MVFALATWRVKKGFRDLSRWWSRITYGPGKAALKASPNLTSPRIRGASLKGRPSKSARRSRLAASMVAVGTERLFIWSVSCDFVLRFKVIPGGTFVQLAREELVGP